MKVAILQNAVGVGGRSKVIAEVIRLLEPISNIIDVHTLSNRSDYMRFVQHYNISNSSINMKSHKGSEIPGTIYQQPILNYVSRASLSNYDLVFNSNNCALFLPDEPKYIHYVHFPTLRTPDVDSKYNKWRYRLASAPIKVISKVHKPRLEGTVFANSAFTLSHLKDCYETSSASVLYPPSLEEIHLEKFSGSGVISVGSFHPNKRQLFQAKVASSFPSTEFRFVGTKASEDYFEKCERYLEDQNLENVSLHTGVSDEELSELLNESRVFLHSMVNEHFGIATIEGLNHGCIPVVHDSGGQREVVSDPQFRYNNYRECVSTLEQVLSGMTPSITSTKDHLEKFTNSRFKNSIREEVYRAVDSGSSTDGV